jgi:hypothetical protein
MKQLERLVVKDTLVTDAGLVHLAGLRELKELDLYGCRISDGGIPSLRGLTHLRRLNLLGAKISDEGLDALAGMEELEELNLYRSEITNAGLERLKKLKKLVSLDLRYSRVTRTGVEGLRAAVPGCKVMFLDPAPARAVKVAPPKGAGDASVAEWARAIGGRARLEAGTLVELTLATSPITGSRRWRDCASWNWRARDSTMTAWKWWASWRSSNGCARRSRS